jgi:hypothetical protein
MSIQTALLAKGAYVSQQQVRDHTVPGGGNDNEILETNIDLAFANLKIMAEGFDYKHQPVPQFDAYMKFIKRNLAAGHPIVWMILLYNGHFPVYVPVVSSGLLAAGALFFFRQRGSHRAYVGTRGYRTAFTRTSSPCMGSSPTTPSTTRPGMHFVHLSLALHAMLRQVASANCISAHHSNRPGPLVVGAGERKYYPVTV